LLVGKLVDQHVDERAGLGTQMAAMRIERDDLRLLQPVVPQQRHQLSGREQIGNDKRRARPQSVPSNGSCAQYRNAGRNQVRGHSRNHRITAGIKKVLAQLLAFAPDRARARIKKRAEEILPAGAGEIRSLPEAQNRIEALLSAGLIESTARFIEHEQSLKTFGYVAGRVMTRLRNDLRLLLLKNDWKGIAEKQLPAVLSGVEKTATADTLTFYKALPH